jgi:hypothetical protein
MEEIIIINVKIMVNISRDFFNNLFLIIDGRQFEDDNRKHNNDDNHYRRGGGGGNDRDRYNGPPRRDHESGRTGKYNHPERGIT